MPEIQVDGKRAFYTTGGKAWESGLPLLVFVHGAGNTQSVWVLQSRALAHHGWNVAAVDLPGHGHSEDREIASMEDYAAWMVLILEELSMENPGLEKAVLAGHSMGAGIALTFAAQHPDRAAGLVLLGTRAEMEVHPGLLRDAAENPHRAAQFIAAYGHARNSHIGHAPTPGNWLLGSTQALVEACDSEVLHRDFQVSQAWRGLDYAGKVACPTLVVTGGKDRMTPAAKGKELAAAIPGASHANLPAAGHFMMNEAPRETLAIMRGFLDGIERA